MPHPIHSSIIESNLSYSLNGSAVSTPTSFSEVHTFTSSIVSNFRDKIWHFDGHLPSHFVAYAHAQCHMATNNYAKLKPSNYHKFSNLPKFLP